MKRLILFEVRRDDLVLSAFVRLLEAIRYWRDVADKNGSVVRVEIYYDGNGVEFRDVETLI